MLSVPRRLRIISTARGEKVGGTEGTAVEEVARARSNIIELFKTT